MSSQNDAGAEPNHAQSVLMHSLLAADTDDSNVDGQKLRLHTFITEVTEITPSKLADALAARMQQTLTRTIDRLGQVYINKVRERVPDAEEVLRIRDEAEGKFYDFAMSLKELLTHAVVDIENYMMQAAFSIDLDLYMGGFLRFRHHEGIDYTDAAGAGALEPAVRAAEGELETLLQELVQLRVREQYLNRLAAEAEQLDRWLETALASGELLRRAEQVRELVAVVREGMASLRRDADGLSARVGA